MPFPPPTKKQAKILWISLTGLAIGILIGLIGLLGWGMGWLINLLAPVLWPLAIAGTIAYLLDPLVDVFIRRKVPRGTAILMVFVIGSLAVFTVMSSVVPRLVYETKRFVHEVPNYSVNAQEAIGKWMDEKPFLQEWKEKFFPATVATSQGTNDTNQISLTLTNDLAASTNIITTPPGGEDSAPMAQDSEATTQITQLALKWGAAILPRVGEWGLNQLKKVTSWAGMLVGLALVPVFVFYFLTEKRNIQSNWTDYLPIHESKLKEELVFVLTAINNYLIAFFRGQVIVAMCIGVLLTIGFLMLGLNYAVLIGVMAGVLSIIPYLGAILTIVPAVALAAIQFKDWWHPIVVIIIFAAVQSLEGLVISPKIMGDRVGLHPMTIIVAVLVGTILMGGILGGILAIPLTAALRVIMFRYIWKQRT